MRIDKLLRNLIIRTISQTLGKDAQKASVPLPPEQLDPRQMKKLETMKESPA